MLPALAIFKGKRALKFKTPKDVKVTVQSKGWMDSELMLKWFKGVILPYTQGKRALLIIDSFSAHETEEFLREAKSRNVDVALIPGGCTSKIQPLDVCLHVQKCNSKIGHISLSLRRPSGIESSSSKMAGKLTICRRALLPPKELG